MVESLNPRGVREGELRDRLISERDKMERKLHKVPQWLSKSGEDLEREQERLLDATRKRREKNAKYGGAMALPVGTRMQDIVEISIRDQILELEEKIFMGSLGTLKVHLLIWNTCWLVSRRPVSP